MIRIIQASFSVSLALIIVGFTFILLTILEYMDSKDVV